MIAIAIANQQATNGVDSTGVLPASSTVQRFWIEQNFQRLVHFAEMPNLLTQRQRILTLKNAVLSSAHTGE
jgi:hypothetical protein